MSLVEAGSRDGAVVRALTFHHWARVRFPDSVSYVVGRPCLERFFSGYSGVYLASKTNLSKFQLDLALKMALISTGRRGVKFVVNERLNSPV